MSFYHTYTQKGQFSGNPHTVLCFMHLGQLNFLNHQAPNRQQNVAIKLNRHTHNYNININNRYVLCLNKHFFELYIFSINAPPCNMMLLLSLIVAIIKSREALTSHHIHESKNSIITTTTTIFCIVVNLFFVCCLAIEFLPSLLYSWLHLFWAYLHNTESHTIVSKSTKYPQASLPVCIKLYPLSSSSPFSRILFILLVTSSTFIIYKAALC